MKIKWKSWVRGGLLLSLLFIVVLASLPQTIVEVEAEEGSSDNITGAEINESNLQNTVFSQNVIEQGDPDSFILPWDIFWRKFKKLSEWRLQWYNQTEAKWVSSESLKILRSRPSENTTKLTLNFTASETGSYRLDFAIQRKVKAYVNKMSNWRYELTYYYEGQTKYKFQVIFDWSDLKDISGLIIKHGVKNNYFWFRLRRDNMPKGAHVTLDPYIIVTQSSVKPTAYSIQEKTFRNPRGQKWQYAMIYNQSDVPDYKLVMYKSENGTSWESDAIIHAFSGSLDYESSSLWIYDNSTLLIVYLVYTEQKSGTETLYYRRGTIADAGTTITLESEQTIATGQFFYPYITVADDGFVWITADKQIGGSWTLYPDNFDNTVTDWTTVGTNPWIDTQDYPTNYIYTSTRNAEMEKWTYNGETVTGTPTSVLLDFYVKGDGNDYIEVYVSGNATANIITPDTSYSWKTVNVISTLGSASAINSATVKITKKNTGSGGTIEVDASRIRVECTVVRTLISHISTATYNPTSAQWSSEKIILSDSEEDEKPNKVLPVNYTITSEDVVILWRLMNDTSGKEYLEAKDARWDGSSFVKSSLRTIQIDFPSDTLEGFNEVGAVVDSNSLVHTSAIFRASPSYYISYQNYTVGTGFGPKVILYGGANPLTETCMSIDLTSSPNKIYVFYRRYGGQTSINYKVGEVASSITWSSQYSVATGLTYGGVDRTSSYRDVDSQVQIIFAMRYIYDVVKWLQVPFALTSYFNTGGSLEVNSTSTSNGTVNLFQPSEYANITAVAGGGYQFDNHTATSDEYGTTVNFTATWIFRINTTNTIWTYFNVSGVVQYSVTFYFYTGGTLLVNGTNRDNGTSTDYNENTVLNITGIADSGYQFTNHTYDSSDTTDNPFYLTVTHTYITHTYFIFHDEQYYLLGVSMLALIVFSLILVRRRKNREVYS